MLRIDLKFAGYFRKFIKEEKEYIKISLESLYVWKKGLIMSL